jgi:hypothetical protein
MPSSRLTALPCLLLATLCARAAHAHQSPIGCNGSGLNFELHRPSSAARGTAVDYEISVSNVDDPSIALRTCDADDVDVTYFCPLPTGAPDYAHPIVVQTDLDVPAGTVRKPLGTRSCTLDVDPRVKEVRTVFRMGSRDGSRRDRAEGALHDGAIDHGFLVEREIGITIVAPAPAVVAPSGDAATAPKRAVTKRRRR